MSLGFPGWLTITGMSTFPHLGEEIEVLKEHQIDLSAVWLWLDPHGEEILNEANRPDLWISSSETGTKTEIWVSFPVEAF